ncbi:MAG: hypothetical protein GY898_11380 [Proteobacteria bacterium]|nr:hypothetical protein [Pseudomonadota bacterium]
MLRLSWTCAVLLALTGCGGVTQIGGPPPVTSDDDKRFCLDWNLGKAAAALIQVQFAVGAL